MKAKEKVVHEEAQELRWPDGQPRTRIQDREARSAWKQTLTKVKENLRLELERSGATSSLITYSTVNHLDPGVAVWFSRKAANQFAWQEALGFIGKVPTVDEINQAYRKAVKPYHPEGATPDLTMFHALTEHRDRALDWAMGRHRNDHQYVFAIDVFDEVRLNLNAVKIVLFSLRRIADCGAPLMLERAYQGFHKQIAVAASKSEVA